MLGKLLATDNVDVLIPVVGTLQECASEVSLNYDSNITHTHVHEPHTHTHTLQTAAHLSEADPVRGYGRASGERTQN